MNGEAIRRRCRANLREGLVIVQGNPQDLDANFPAAKSPFPHVGEATKGDRVTTNFDEIAGHDVRGREGSVASADGP